MRRRHMISIVLVLMLVTTSGAAIAGQTGDNAAAAPTDEARGLVFDGLVPGDPDGPCAGAFEVALADGGTICTQGPDGAPAGIDVQQRSVPMVAAVFEDLGKARLDDSAACVGDGVSGPRVQAIYAVASDRPDRFELAKPYIEAWAGRVDDVFMESAARAAGVERRVRWVTAPDCSIDIARVVVSPSGDNSFGTMINEMLAQGWDRPDRKYLVWMDARVYCGIGQFYNDDRPGLDNRNNGAVPMFARVDEGCWGLSQSVEAHELTHVLGGVQHSAPHATHRGHCWDEWDLMCYNDGSGIPMQAVCPTASAGLLDCNHDDYFHPNPPSGSYLDSHWNTADSSFLAASGTPPTPPPPQPDPPPPPPEPDPPPPPPPPPPPEPEPDPGPNQAPRVSAGPDVATVVNEWMTLRGTATDDGLPYGRLAVRWSKVRGPGAVSFENDRSAQTRARFSEAGVYELRLRGADGELAAADRVIVTVSDRDQGGDSVTERFEGMIPRGSTMASIEFAAGAGAMNVILEFEGETRRGRVPTMVLKVYDNDGRLIAIRRGRSPISLDVDLERAGMYRVVVRGPGGTAYRVAVTHPPFG